MVRKYKDVTFTEEDWQGFCFHEVEEEEKNKFIKGWKKNRNRHFVYAGLLLLPSLLVGFCNNDAIRYFNSLYQAIIFFYFLFNYCLWYTKMRRMRKKKMIYVEAEVLDKLSIEKVESDNDFNGISDISYFYPVKGKDITTGYESVCYIDRKQYENSVCHDKIKVYEYVKKEKKK